MTAVSAGGGRELLFADDYNEAEADSEGGLEEDDEDRWDASWQCGWVKERAVAS